jgi:molybdopterin-guanine dinucleotide biosynthesis protein A
LIFISINTNQSDSYQKIINSNLLIKDSLDLKGPLAGLLSVHQQLSDKDLLIIACDMIDIQTDTITALITHFYSNSSVAEAVIYRKDGEFEPLLGIYSSPGLSKILALYTKGNLHHHSMKHVLEILHTLALPIPEHKIQEFENYNFKENLSE